MSIASADTVRPGRPIGPPGVYLQDRAPIAAGTPTLMTGVPAFIGFAKPKPSVSEPAQVWERRQVVAVALDDPNEFERSISPGAGSFLPMVVRGFFANGGKRCVV